MQQEHTVHPQQPMPQQQVAMQEHQPMAMQVEKAVPLQQAAVQHQPGSTMPLPTGLGLQAMWAEGQGGASGSATAISGNDRAYSGSAAAASGIGPTADPCQWPEKKANELKGEMAQAPKFFNVSIQNLGITVEHKADC